ncbi:RimK family alpha-L-glutamate ligase [Saccharicrinis sp. FJH2]|uniref:ATP-grasp domain-containing protein n=1 Tax=Saccharicrinis sp. FJH65 TaxID=3344659 RepID=UPI0035F4B2D2
MKIGIHKTPGSFSDSWLKYCKENNISYKLVNCFASDIIEQLNDCDGLMWHWDQNCYKAALFARQLTFSLEKKGIHVFPSIDTSWHHDDKVGQKYLLESIKAPFVDSFVFYSKNDALKWIEKTSFPKVFKLKGGAGSINVKLVTNKKNAYKIVRKAFGKGFSHIDRIQRLKDRVWALKRDKNLKSLKEFVTGIIRLFVSSDVEKYTGNSKGYVYFQEFIPENKTDTRIVIVDDRCYGMIRFCRKGDFRASGSGLKSFNHNDIPTSCIKIAFEVSQQLNMQAVAFDFINHNGSYKIIEISYCFVTTQFPGYWDKKYVWHDESSSPQIYMIEKFISNLPA